MKKEDAALNYTEMLGVLSNTDIDFQTTSWDPLPESMDVDDSTAPEFVFLGYQDTGHMAYQYCIDGVFMGVQSAQRQTYQSPDDRELWLCGSVINGNNPTTAFGNIFERRNYDWDWRLEFTLPPYFLRAYNATAVQVRGTWRSYYL